MDLWSPTFNKGSPNNSSSDEANRWCCSFCFDPALDVIEQEALNEKACKQVLSLTIQKEDTETSELRKESDIHQNKLQLLEEEDIQMEEKTSSLLALHEQEKETINPIPSRQEELDEYNEVLFNQEEYPAFLDPKQGGISDSYKEISSRLSGIYEQDFSNSECDPGLPRKTYMNSSKSPLDVEDCSDSERESVGDTTSKNSSSTSSIYPDKNYRIGSSELLKLKVRELKELAKKLKIVKYHKLPKDMLVKMIATKMAPPSL